MKVAADQHRFASEPRHEPAAERAEDRHHDGEDGADKTGLRQCQTVLRNDRAEKGREYLPVHRVEHVRNAEKRNDSGHCDLTQRRCGCGGPALRATGLTQLTCPDPPDLLTSVMLVRSGRPPGGFSRRQGIFPSREFGLVLFPAGIAVGCPCAHKNADALSEAPDPRSIS
jgi:hypothetical protein